MQTDYEEVPIIPPFTGIEDGIKQFWEASQAWTGDPLLAPKYTVGRLFEVLHPLQTQTKSTTLREQSTALAKQIVHNKWRRSKRKGTVTSLQQYAAVKAAKAVKTKNNSQSIKIA